MRPARAARARCQRDRSDARGWPGDGGAQGGRRCRGIPFRLPLLPLPLSIPLPLSLPPFSPPPAPPPALSVRRSVQRPAARLGCRTLGMAGESIRAIPPRLGSSLPRMITLDRIAVAVVLGLIAHVVPVAAAGPYPPYPPYPNPPDQPNPQSSPPTQPTH